MKVNFKEVIGKTLANKKLGTALKVVGVLASGVAAVVMHNVEKKETDEKLEKLVNDKFAGK